MPKTAPTDTGLEINIPSAIAGTISLAATMALCNTLEFSAITIPLSAIVGVSQIAIHDDKLRKGALIFGASMGVFFNVDPLLEVPEKLLDEPSTVFLAGGVGASWYATSRLNQYISYGEEIHEYNLDLYKKSQMLTSRDQFMRFKNRLDTDREIDSRFYRALSVSRLNDSIETSIPEKLQPFIKGSLNLPTKAQKSFEDSLSFPELPTPQPVPALQPSNPVPDRSTEFIPDGAVLVKAEDLGNVNKYPVIAVIAGQGCGKSATVGWIFSQLSGNKVVSSPKPIIGKLQSFFDLIFGYDRKNDLWTFFGDIENDDFSPYLDLTYFKNMGEKFAGSVLSFLWAARRESLNRQNGQTENKEPWRCFYDEASYTYGTGFNDPLAPPAKEKKSKEFVSGIMKDAFQNFRGQQIQWWFGAQVESVDAVGLKNFSAARDEAWHLYPGPAAITACYEMKKPQLANWFKRRAEKGLGIALLEKKGTFFEVIELPTIAELSSLTDTTVKDDSETVEIEVQRVDEADPWESEEVEEISQTVDQSFSKEDYEDPLRCLKRLLEVEKYSDDQLIEASRKLGLQIRKETITQLKTTLASYS